MKDIHTSLPCSPPGPGGPRAPMGPGGPDSPCSPRAPWKPWGPGDPGGPGGPRGPIGPCNNTWILSPAICEILLHRITQLIFRLPTHCRYYVIITALRRRTQVN